MPTHAPSPARARCRSDRQIFVEDHMRRYADGDARAFASIYAATHARLHAYFMGVTRNHHRAEDLCQLTYLKLHRARARWVRGTPLGPWLMVIARNAWLDDERKRRRDAALITASGQLPEREDHAAAESIAAIDRRPDAALVGAVVRAIDGLTPLQRQALMLVKFRGMSYRCAAALLDTTVTAAKLRVQRARDAVRRETSAFARA